MAATFDAVVIGAGHNGLAAAVHLASRGWRVAVVEGAAVPGGAVKTAELTLPGFRHDLYAMNLSLFAGSPFFAAHGEALRRHGLELVPSANCFVTAFPDDTWFGVSQDLAETAARAEALQSGDGARWRALHERFGREAPHIFAALGAPMPSLKLLRALWTAARRLGIGGLGEILRLVLSSPRDFLDAHMSGEKVKAAMATWGLHLDFAPDVAGGALFPYLESFASQSFGMAFGRGGADTIVKALTGTLAEFGGTLRLSSPAEGVVLKDGRAAGVRLAGGEVLEATRAVIATCHPHILFGRLLPADPARETFDRRIAAFRPGPGALMVHVAASSLPNWRAGEALRRFPYVHLAPSLEAMARTYTQAMAGLLPAEPVLVVGQPTAVDASRAPAGRHVLWIQVRVVPSTIRGDAAGQIGDTDWDAAKEFFADRVLDIVERYAPGFRDTVLARAVHSPADLQRENPNLVGGDSLGGSHHLDQNFLFRPVPGWSRYRTPVKGLFMAGASTWPGAGTGAGSGFILAKMLAGQDKGGRRRAV